MPKVLAGVQAQQVNAWRLSKQGWSEEDLRDKHWGPHHTWAGQEFYQARVCRLLAVSG